MFNFYGVVQEKFKKTNRFDIKKTHDILYLPPQEDVLAFLGEEEIHVVVIDLDLRKHQKKVFGLLKKIKAFDVLIDVLILGATSPEETPFG